MTTTTTNELLLVGETVVQENGAGESFEVASGPRMFVCQLDILEQIDQESLEISIWGSADGQDWGKQPLLKFPQRFYRGATQMVLDLAPRPEVKFIRAKWEVNRWGRGRPVPVFRFRLRARPVG